MEMDNRIFNANYDDLDINLIVLNSVLARQLSSHPFG